VRVFVIIFLTALTLAAISTPLIRRLAVWTGFVDMPAGRKLHNAPMPLLGGLAIAASALIAFLLLVSILPITFLATSVIGAVLACGIIIIVGLVDDRRHLPAWVKFAGQLIAALILIYAGVQVRLGIPEWLNVALTVVWLVGITNAMNFMDNMDGLSAGVSAVAAAFILLLATFNNQHLVAALAAGILGACLGFLRYNFKPARIFMGDTGSMFLGFLLAVLCIQLRFPDNVNFVTWMIPVFIMGLPIFDTTLVVISRMRRHVNPLTTAGKDHLSHRLVNRGFTQREAVLILYLIAGTFGMVGLFITSADVLEGYVLGISVFVIGLLAIWQLERRTLLDDA
jgi:UDP-GlcNAc:undecaprenyl-phosphate GlcNAc-1-phosphate transferase